VTLSLPCPIFGSVFQYRKGSDTAKGKSKTEIYAVRGTWAERAARQIGGVDWQAQTTETFLQESRRAASKKDALFLGYYSLDIFLCDKLVPLTRKQLFSLALNGGQELSEEAIANLDYLLPQAALIGGLSLASQPRMLDLARDLGKLLWRIELLFRGLSPCQPNSEQDWRPRLGALRRPGRARLEAATWLLEASKTRAHSELEEYGSSEPETAKLLPELFKAIGREMGNSLCADKTQRAEFTQLFDEWGWAIMIELIGYSSVDFSGELLFQESIL
jgi:hypothetical protein